MRIVRQCVRRDFGRLAVRMCRILAEHHFAMTPARPLTGLQTTFPDHEIIVSKTDARGIITYVNSVFRRVSGYEEHELIGAPHNLIRHPRMPRGVFKLLWDSVRSGQEIFAYVLNRAKNGDEYWVFAHVTPSYDSQGQLVGYHSNRRSPYRDALPKVERLYAALLEKENQYRAAAEAAQAGLDALNSVVAASHLDYAEFVFSLSRQTNLKEGGR
jgi:PAS domain S-box-containing protein